MSTDSWFVATILILQPSISVAALPKPETRTVPSADGKFLLIVLIPPSERSLRSDRSISEQEQIEKQFRQSGLYRNDGAHDLLWPFEYVSTSKEIHVCNDGVHLVLAYLDWDGTASDRGNALEFYANGQQLASYNEDRLLIGYIPRRILHALVGFAEPVCTAATLEDGAKTFEIETNWGDAFRFDIETGKLISSRLPWSFKCFFLLAGLFVALVGWWLYRRIARKTRDDKKLGIDHP
jgi:hypothetical protein